MSMFMSILAVVISISIGLAISKKVQSFWTARPWWIAFSSAVGILGGYYLLGHVYNMIEVAFLKSVAASHVYGAVTLIAIIVGAIIGGTIQVNKFFNLSTSKQLLVWFFAIIIGGGAGFKYLGLTVTPILYVEIIGSLVCVMSLIFVAYYWQRGIQDAASLYVGYIMVIAMYSVMSWAVIGINPMENLKGSLTTILPFAIFNTGLVVLIWIFGKKKPFREMTGYKLIYLLVCLMVGFTILTTVLQLTGNINKHEHQALRMTNRAKWYSDDFQRRKRLETTVDGKKYFAALKNLTEAKGDAALVASAKQELQASMTTGESFVDAQRNFDTAVQTGNEAAMKKAKATLEAHLDLQKKYEDEKMEWDDGYLAPWRGVMGLYMQWKPSSKTTAHHATKKEVVNISEPGSFNFKLEPYKDNGQWLYVKSGLKYCPSTPPNQPFLVKYKRGDTVEVRGNGMKLPNKAGEFRLQALEKPVSITLLVSR